jgi:hypothetical protein
VVLVPRPTAALAVEFNSMLLIASATVAALAKTILRMAAPFNADYDEGCPSKAKNSQARGKVPSVLYTLKIILDFDNDQSLTSFFRPSMGMREVNGADTADEVRCDRWTTSCRTDSYRNMSADAGTGP